ncbi:hypothetical protein LOAG_12089 [Loa loa]|uniref:Uncharacterized protein n=1 Tax=Loa loa TaxID=7209 RepID=A0A1S0TMC4_LOALO|nr:hypothetical protein LOAG_12089 [Loa loa]EFO16419.1 hypothetical protein LOAG_12089 [Loa loa]
MNFPIIAYLLIIANLLHSVQCLQCYESVGNISFPKICSPKQKEHEMCFASKIGVEGLCVRGCSFETLHYGSYEYSLNCSDAICMKDLGCCCKGNLCNSQCSNEAATIGYCTLLVLQCYIFGKHQSKNRNNFKQEPDLIPTNIQVSSN